MAHATVLCNVKFHKIVNFNNDQNVYFVRALLSDPVIYLTHSVMPDGCHNPAALCQSQTGGTA